MLFGNALELALRKSGLVNKKRKKRKPRYKKFECKKCGAPMIRIEGTNIMSCSKCANYYIFDK